ncbi:MFS transporter [Agrobacterium vitis]|uniref:MFS transporter n=1 Tax=Agrobacterium vitis TaxID=373 RepID=UPI00203599B1|nr:MFS transporter [Agrobacterium vitis]MCM2449744.1 MFS transporter [Agrobacterium vitis]
MSATSNSSAGRASAVIISVGCLILFISFGVRSTFGVLMEPMSRSLAWPQETMSLVLALQNIVWGIGQPVFGLIADRIGYRKALFVGSALYAIGMLLAAWSMTPMTQNLTTGVLVGAGISGTSFGMILAVLGRSVAPERRSFVLGLGTAIGSAGQVFFPILTQQVLVWFEWDGAMVMLGLSAIVMLPLIAFGIPAMKPAPGATIVIANNRHLLKALRDPDFSLIVLGFFSCGYQLAFISAHFPGFVTDLCGSPTLGATAIALIGLINILGSLLAGHLGARYPKKNLLAIIYLARTIICAAFVLIPASPATVVVFSLVMGAIWLSTVPLTSGLVSELFGTQHIATLFGIVFLGHQIGSALGVWVGGYIYDSYQTDLPAWWFGVAVSGLSILVHIPIREVKRPWAVA